jgi:hypothetical protein
MKREDYLEWCKKRALKHIDAGDLAGAYTSMAYDLRKHPETENHVGIKDGMMLLITGNLSTADEMRKFIEGFN